MEPWIIIHTTTYPQDIYLPQSLLESEGIPTILRDELTAQVHNFYSTAIGGVKLLVRQSDAPRALEILADGGFIGRNADSE